MTVSMRVMSAGDGYKYLLRTVAAGDGDRSLTTPLTRDYSAEGTPPGRWMGAGLSALGNGQLMPSDEVSEAQLQLLVGMGCDPITRASLGRAYPIEKALEERVQSRDEALGSSLRAVGRGRAVPAGSGGGAQRVARGSGGAFAW